METLTERSKQVKETLKSIQDDVTSLQSQVLACALEFPNETHSKVPVGKIILQTPTTQIIKFFNIKKDWGREKRKFIKKNGRTRRESRKLD